MKEYNDALQYVLDNGILTTNRTGIDTISLFGMNMRFNLQDGFPAVTTKKLAWRAVVGELLWFLEGSTDERRLAEITFEKPREQLTDKQTIWSANADQQGRDLGYTNNDKVKLLGPVYGHGWRRSTSLNTSSLIEMKQVIHKEAYHNPIIEDSLHAEDDEYIGKYITNKQGTEYKVLKKINTPRNSTYQIQCIKTGHKECVSRPNIRSCTFGQRVLFDRFYSTARKSKDIPYYTKAYNMWYNMIDRCYNIKNKNYPNYGGRGVIVDVSWYNFETFLYDIESLPFFYEWANGVNESINDWCLDKDYYNTNLYSKSTCIFLPSKLNKAYSNTQIDFSKKHVVEFPNGVKYEFIFMNDVIAKFPHMRFNKESIRLCLTSSQETHRGCKFYSIVANDNHCFRKKVVFDQISDLISTIKNNPDSRRLILTAWNPNQLNEMALPPCHVLSQYRVINRKLSCLLYQRSADLFLGSPFNIASYALLTHMLAKICSLEVGELVYNIGDAHIYTNHLDAVDHQLKRTPHKRPKLIMPEISSLAISDIQKLKVSDFILEGYSSHPTIKAEMAV